MTPNRPVAADVRRRIPRKISMSCPPCYLGGYFFRGRLRFPPHRHQAISRNTLVRHDAEELARRHACIVGEHLEVVSGGKPLAKLPRIDRGNRKAQVSGNLLQRDALL